MSDLVQAGNLLAQCQIVGAGNQAEGFIVASFCYQMGISYVEFAETYNIVFGRIAKRVDAMLADANTMGIKHKAVARTPELATIELTMPDGAVVRESLTHDQVKNEKFYGKNPKWKTEYSRRQMLWARVVSESLRTHAPATCNGMYTAEEVADIHAEDSPAIDITSGPVPLEIPEQSEVIDVNWPEHVKSCPIEPHKGRPWRDFPPADLQIALTVEQVPSYHKDYIRGLLKAMEALK